MILREFGKLFPDYRLFKSISHPQRYYAILKTDVERIEKIRKVHSDIDAVPDFLAVKALPLATGNNDFYDVFDHRPTHHPINDLIEEDFPVGTFK